MFRALIKILSVALIMVIGAGGIYWFSVHNSAEQKLREAQERNQQLTQIVQRLTDEKRVAEVIVTDQKTVDGKVQTTLLFDEYARDGSSLPPRTFTIEGKIAHIDAMVIKFDRHFVSENDPLRGHSIALFTKLYGDEQAPAGAAMIDTPGKVPDVYKGSDPRAAGFEQELWTDFWRLYDDEDYRKEKGVRTLSGQGVWGPFEMDKLYTISLESDGGLNITAGPQKGIYRAAMRQLSKTDQ